MPFERASVDHDLADAVDQDINVFDGEPQQVGAGYRPSV
jgi:hypothetical protein